MTFLSEMREHVRWLNDDGVKKITEAVDAAGNIVPIEACFIYLIPAAQEEEVRSTVLAFVPKEQYRLTRRYFLRELGALEGCRIVLDDEITAPQAFGKDWRQWSLLEEATW